MGENNLLSALVLVIIISRPLSVYFPIMFQNEKDGMKALLVFSPQLMGKHCSLTGVDILQEEVRLSFAVDVVLPDSRKCLVVWVKNPLQLRLLCSHPSPTPVLLPTSHLSLSQPLPLPFFFFFQFFFSPFHKISASKYLAKLNNLTF